MAFDAYFAIRGTLLILEASPYKLEKTVLPLVKLLRVGFFYEHQWTNAVNTCYYWDSPLKKGDKGGCFLCRSNPAIMSFQPEDV
jgi:hypothetical protein